MPTFRVVQQVITRVVYEIHAESHDAAGIALHTQDASAKLTEENEIDRQSWIEREDWLMEDEPEQEASA